jgi:hypothetical protein
MALQIDFTELGDALNSLGDTLHGKRVSEKRKREAELMQLVQQLQTTPSGPARETLAQRIGQLAQEWDIDIQLPQDADPLEQASQLAGAIPTPGYRQYAGRGGRAGRVYDPAQDVSKFSIMTGYSDVTGMDGSTIWDRQESVEGLGVQDTIARLRAIAESDEQQYQQHVMNASTLLANPNIVGTLDEATLADMQSGDINRVLPQMKRLLKIQETTDKMVADVSSPAGVAKREQEFQDSLKEYDAKQQISYKYKRAYDRERDAIKAAQARNTKKSTAAISGAAMNKMKTQRMAQYKAAESEYQEAYGGITSIFNPGDDVSFTGALDAANAQALKGIADYQTYDGGSGLTVFTEIAHWLPDGVDPSNASEQDWDKARDQALKASEDFALKEGLQFDASAWDRDARLILREAKGQPITDATLTAVESDVRKLQNAKAKRDVALAGYQNLTLLGELGDSPEEAVANGAMIPGAMDPDIQYAQLKIMKDEIDTRKLAWQAAYKQYATGKGEDDAQVAARLRTMEADIQALQNAYIQTADPDTTVITPSAIPDNTVINPGTVDAGDTGFKSSLSEGSTAKPVEGEAKIKLKGSHKQAAQVVREELQDISPEKLKEMVKTPADANLLVTHILSKDGKDWDEDPAIAYEIY